MTNQYTPITWLVYGEFVWPSGISQIGCNPIVNVGLVKASQRKCKVFRLWPSEKRKRKSLTHLPTAVKRDDICLIKISRMCDKYCITVNELYSPLEWFIMEKMLIKKRQEPQQRPTTTCRHTDVWGIALEMST